MCFYKFRANFKAKKILYHCIESFFSELTNQTKTLTDKIESTEKHLQNHGHGNEKRIDDLSNEFKAAIQKQQSLITRVEITEQEIKAISEKPDLSIKRILKWYPGEFLESILNQCIFIIRHFRINISFDCFEWYI